MLSALAPVAALLLSCAILLMGNGLQGTLLPVRGLLENFTETDIGIMGAAYFLGFGAGCLLGPHVVRRVGHIRAFTAMVALASTVALAHALILSPFAWWPLRAVTGFCFAGIFMVIESWLNEKSTNETRGLVFSVYTIINLTVISAGQMMLTLSSPAAFTLFATASILVSLAALPVALTRAPAPKPISAVKVRPRRLFKLSPVGCLGGFGVGLVSGAFWSLAPVFAQKEAADLDSIAIFMSVAVIAGAIGQWPLGRLSDRVDRRLLIIVACLGACFAAIALTLSSQYFSQGIFVFGALFGAFAFPLYALCIAHTNDFVEPDGYVEASSGLLLIFAGGAVLGPIIASTAMRLLGVDGLFVFTATVHVLIATFAVFRMRQRESPVEAGRAKFEDSMIRAQTVTDVDPTSGTHEGGTNVGGPNVGGPDEATADGPQPNSTTEN